MSRSKCEICNVETDIGYRTFFGVKQNEAGENKIAIKLGQHFCAACTKTLQKMIDKLKKEKQCL